MRQHPARIGFKQRAQSEPHEVGRCGFYPKDHRTRLDLIFCWSPPSARGPGEGATPPPNPRRYSGYYFGLQSWKTASKRIVERVITSAASCLSDGCNQFQVIVGTAMRRSSWLLCLALVP